MPEGKAPSWVALRLTDAGKLRLVVARCPSLLAPVGLGAAVAWRRYISADAARCRQDVVALHFVDSACDREPVDAACSAVRPHARELCLCT